MASIGQVSNIDHENVKIGKSGRKRNMGWRPDRQRFRHEPERPPRTAAVRARALSDARARSRRGGKPALGYKTRR